MHLFTNYFNTSAISVLIAVLIALFIFSLKIMLLALSSYIAGKNTLTVVLFSNWLSTSIFPSCNSTNSFAILSPIPLPSLTRDNELST